MVPEGQPGKDQLFEITEDRFHRFALFRSGGWKQALQLTGLAVGQRWILPGIFEIICDPFQQKFAMLAEIFRAHIMAAECGVVGVLLSHDGSLARFSR